MRVPSLLETQAHLRDVNFCLERIENDPEKPAKYLLTNHMDREWGTFDNLISFWSFWLDYAAKVLSEGQIAEAFVSEFRNATRQRRSEMIDWYEGWLSNTHPQPYEDFVASIRPLDPDDLPSGWERMLKNNLRGPIAGRRAGSCTVQLLAQIDPLAYKRFKDFPNRYGLPQLPLVD